MPNALQPYHMAWLSAHPERNLKWLKERLADGFQIHHVDGNHANNAIDNLLLVDGFDHMRLHGIRKMPKVQNMAEIGRKGAAKANETRARKRRLSIINRANCEKRWDKFFDRELAEAADIE